MEPSAHVEHIEKKPQEAAGSHLKRGAIALLILIAGFGLFKFLDYYVTTNHLADLPPGYITKETDRFQAFFSPDTRDSADRMLKAGEQFIDSFSSRYSQSFGGLEPPSNRIRLTLFRNHEEFRRFARKSLKVDLSNNGGYCDAANQEIVLVMSNIERDLGSIVDASLKLQLPTSEEADVMAMRHELVHYLMERGGGDFGSRAAPWLSEGLAGLFEMPDAGDGEPPPLAQWATLVLAVSSDTPRISQLVNVSSDSYRGEANLYVYTFSALLVRFLWKDDVETLWSYVRRMRDGDEPGWKTFESHFSYDPDLENRWQTMIAQLRQDARSTIKRAYPKQWRHHRFSQ